jgi:hypothetical protein
MQLVVNNSALNTPLVWLSQLQSDDAGRKLF